MSIDPVLGGGTAERTIQMSKALCALGHECSILTLDLGLSENKKNEIKQIKNLKLYTLECLGKRFYIPSPPFDIVEECVKKADIVHLMTHWTLINAIVYYYIRKHKKNYVVCPAGALPIFGRSRYIKLIYNFIVGTRLIQNASAHIAVAKDEFSHFEKYGVSSEKIFWIPNGIDPSDLESKTVNTFRKDFHLPESPFLFFIGRLNPIKGPDLLVEAFCQAQKELTEYHLVLAGPDEGMLESLKKTVDKNNLSHKVHFIGHISGEAKSQALQTAALMIIPSRQEAMSIVVLEAGTCSLPVLVTDMCGLNDLQDIQAAIVVSPTVEGIKAGLVNALSSKENLFKLGDNLKRYVHSQFLWSTVIKKLEALYLSFIKNGSKS